MNGGGDNQEVEECGNAHGGDAYTDHHFLRRRLRALLDRVQDALEAVEDHGGRSKHPRSADKPGSAITRAPERLHILRSEEHTSELQSLMRISYAVFRLKKTTDKQTHQSTIRPT